MNKYTGGYDTFYLPFIQPLLEQLSLKGELVFAIAVPRRDGSVCGKECMVLMISLIYKKRAIPIAWLVKKEGTFSSKSSLPTSRKSDDDSTRKLPQSFARRRRI